MLRVLRTADLTDDLEVALRRLLLDAFADDFSDDDWDHALGGEHVIVAVGGRPVAHASVVPRVLELGERRVRTGYVEAVGTAAAAQGRGFGRRVMAEIETLVRREFEMGGLATGEHEFYARLGWERWRGPTSVRRGDQARAQSRGGRRDHGPAIRPVGRRRPGRADRLYRASW